MTLDVMYSAAKHTRFSIFYLSMCYGLEKRAIFRPFFLMVRILSNQLIL